MTFPQPKFQVGEPVFAVNVDRDRKQHPCPDCRDTREWTATSATGETFKVQCLRCVASYSGLDTPSLMYEVATVSLRTLTVGSVKMDTEPHEGSTVFQYMCHETGVGSGRIYNEGGRYGLFATETEAQEYAEILRREEDARIVAAPQHLLAADYAIRTLKTAVPHHWRDEIYHAWDRARDYKEAMEAVIGDEIADLDAARAHLREALVERSWRRAHPVDTLIAAVKAVIVGGDPQVLADALKLLDYDAATEKTKAVR